jgi:hypothetical protein
MATFAWVLLILPWLAGLYGLAMAFNVFGVARREAEFYRGHGDWYPILDGEDASTHRLAGALLVCFAGFATWMLASQGVL